MKRYFNFIVALTLMSCQNDFVAGTDGGSTGNTAPQEPPTKIISSYVRNNFLETNRVSTESMNACNDLIILGINPYADGSLYYEIPDNNATFSKVTYLNEYKGRNGVVSFRGEGEMTGGNDLLHTPLVWGNNNSGKYPQFTFGTWIYVDEWVKGACLFKKENQNNKIAFKQGDSLGEFVFVVDNKEVVLSASDFKVGKWIHLSLTYSSVANNKGTHLYVDGKKVASETGILTDKLPYIRSSMFLGTGLKAELDETFFNGLALSESEIAKIKESGIEFTSWNMSKTLAYWKFDEETDKGKDSHTWVDLLERVKGSITNPYMRIRAGITSGDWKTMCSKESYRNSFAENVKNLLEKYHFDGVDLDFEWPLTSAEYTNYSATILKLREVIGEDKILTVSLHPLYYKISQEAIGVVDHISLQCYGPSPDRFSYETYVKEAEDVVKYGIPKEKLVMGLPFYGAEEHKQGTASYWDFVQENLITDPKSDEVIYKQKKYIFNGQETISKKTKYVMEHDIAGVMTWDLATDVTLSHPKSLLKSMVEEINKQ